jgi:hypothetical protein
MSAHREMALKVARGEALLYSAAWGHQFEPAPCPTGSPPMAALWTSVLLRACAGRRRWLRGTNGRVRQARPRPTHPIVIQPVSCVDDQADV